MQEVVDDHTSERDEVQEEEDQELALVDITPDWLREQVGEEKQADVLSVLGNASFAARECEKKLLKLLGPKKVEVVRLLATKRHVVLYGTLLS